jgi:hypothetical protein
MASLFPFAPIWVEIWLKKQIPITKSDMS